MDSLAIAARYMQGDLSAVSADLRIPFDEMKAIRSKFKTREEQALGMLKYCQERSARQLASTLRRHGFTDAADV